MERERKKKGGEGHKRREREEIGGKLLEGGWGEGCVHRYIGVYTPLFVVNRNTYNSFLGQN
jgi:hypothetical protein